MNKHQIRAIRNSFNRDKVYTDPPWNNFLLKHHIMRCKIEEVEFVNCKKPDIYLQYILTKKENIYKAYCIHYNHSSQILYAITLNDRIIYWISSSIALPAHDAWRALTEVYHGYNEHTCYRWKSTIDFDCIDIFLTKAYKDKTGQNGFHYMDYLHSPMQIKKWDNENKYYIDKEIITNTEADEISAKLYYHL